MTPDQNQSLMLITKMLENNTQEIRGLQEDVSKIIEKIHEVKIEVRDLKKHEILNTSPEELKNAKIKDYAKGTGIGATLATLITALWEYAKTNYL